MKISFITPTSERPLFLQGLYTLVQKQTYPNWEWLIYDSSFRPQNFDDTRVVYLHDESIVSIGEKRNRLIERASGDLIVHLDDDDYYAPEYGAFIVEQLRKTDFFTAHSWFSYDLKSKQTYYWATDEITRTQFVINALSGGRVRELDFGFDSEAKLKLLNEKGQMGYGFSYAYRKRVAEKCPFVDSDFGEDKKFYLAVEAAGYTIGSEKDYEGRAVHVIHETNTSGEYPQYRIPRFLAKKHMPGFFTHISRFHED
ncbi:MAG: glycosyltransferase family 2 protein [Chlamydiales bacterium]|nr:glycosyltransferase family 2 protein [Chlamydiales bacterium]